MGAHTGRAVGILPLRTDDRAHQHSQQHTQSNIQREGPSIKGLTTAASIWATGCLGVAVGGGDYLGGSALRSDMNFRRRSSAWRPPKSALKRILKPVFFREKEKKL